MLKQALLALALTFCGLGHAASIYKWTDHGGHARYTAIPPPIGTPYEVINKPAPPSRDPAAVMESLREQARSSSSGDKGQSSGNGDQARQDRLALWAENCKFAQSNRAILDSDRDVVSTDPDGNKVVMSAKERQAALKQAEKDIAYYCNP